MKVYVDADACPVKEEIIKESRNHQVQVILVKSFSHYTSSEDPEGVKTVYVDTGADAVDYRIMLLAQKKDVIITQDYGLASLGLSKGCKVIHHKGFEYTLETIDQLLLTRHFSAKARKSGERTKGPKAFTKQDRLNFQAFFANFLKNVI